MSHVAFLAYLAAAVVSVASIIVGRPWVDRLARRETPRDVRRHAGYREMTFGLTAIWAVLFVAAALAQLVVDVVSGLLIGAVLLLLGRLSPRIGRWYVERRLGVR